MFSWEFCEISKNTFFTEHLWTTASVAWNDTDKVYIVLLFIISTALSKLFHTVMTLGSFCWNQTMCKTSNRNQLKANKLKWIIVMVKPEIWSCKLASLKISGKFPRKSFVSIKTTSCKTSLKWTLLRVILRNLTNNADGYFSDKLWTPERLPANAFDMGYNYFYFVFQKIPYVKHLVCKRSTSTKYWKYEFEATMKLFV